MNDERDSEKDHESASALDFRDSERDPEVRAAVGKASWRLVPFLCVLYLSAYLDRFNVGFASLTMNQDIGISMAAYGFAASMFFVGYILFEIPSNLILGKVGAPPLDCAHHDHVGNRIGLYDFCQWRTQLERFAIPARGR
jgi:hypothetical protein